MRDIIKKIPKLRGHGKNRSRTVRNNPGYAPINLAALEASFNDGDKVNNATLTQKGLTSLRGGRVAPVKILGTGTLTKKLSLSGLVISETAKAAVEAAGGSVL